MYTATPTRRASRPRAVRAARMIERRRPATMPQAQRTKEPATPIMRFDDEPYFIGDHLSSQLIQRNWRWW